MQLSVVSCQNHFLMRNLPLATAASNLVLVMTIIVVVMMVMVVPTCVRSVPTAVIVTALKTLGPVDVTVWIIYCHFACKMIHATMKPIVTRMTEVAARTKT
jgi:hypothetical protein